MLATMRCPNQLGLSLVFRVVSSGRQTTKNITAGPAAPGRHKNSQRQPPKARMLRFATGHCQDAGAQPPSPSLALRAVHAFCKSTRKIRCVNKIIRARYYLQCLEGSLKSGRSPEGPSAFFCWLCFQEWQRRGVKGIRLDIQLRTCTSTAAALVLMVRSDLTQVIPPPPAPAQCLGKPPAGGGVVHGFGHRVAQASFSRAHPSTWGSAQEIPRL